MRRDKPVQLNGKKEFGNVPRQQNRFYSIFSKCVAIQLPFGENLIGGGIAKILIVYEKQTK